MLTNFLLFPVCFKYKFSIDYNFKNSRRKLSWYFIKKIKPSSDFVKRCFMENKIRNKEEDICPTAKTGKQDTPVTEDI